MEAMGDQGAGQVALHNGFQSDLATCCCDATASKDHRVISPCPNLSWLSKNDLVDRAQGRMQSGKRRLKSVYTRVMGADVKLPQQNSDKTQFDQTAGSPGFRCKTRETALSAQRRSCGEPRSDIGPRGKGPEPPSHADVAAVLGDKYAEILHPSAIQPLADGATA